MRLAFVTPRYGADLVGGAEAHVREAALGLADRGHEVEVLTTVATDAQTWAPVLEPGTEKDGAVTVRRFPLTAAADHARRDALDHLVLSGRPLSVEDELAWVDVRFQVPALVRHLTEEGGGYDAVAYSPYLFWTTLRCLHLTRARSILIPCLHDEPPARLGIVRATLAAAAQVWFLSEPEHQLAHRLVPLGPHRVVGAAVREPGDTDPEGFRRRHGIARPFALYAGRREDGKGWPQAVAGFATAVDRHGVDLDLVTFGTGTVDVAGPLRDRVVDLGFLDPAEVPDAVAAASVFLQPSPNESFSRTVMEAWLAGVPVVATAAGEVVAWHCERSGGGLLYGDDLEMAECIHALVEDTVAAAALGAAGRDYVRAQCSWPAVLDRMEEALADVVRDVGRAREAAAGTPGAPAAGTPATPAAGPSATPATDSSEPCATATATAVALALGSKVRDRAVQDRRAEVPLTPGFPLAPWLPAPGTGVSQGVSAVRSSCGPRVGQAKPGVPRRLLRRTARVARTMPPVRRLEAALRAAKAAWASEEPVAPPRDVR